MLLIWYLFLSSKDIAPPSQNVMAIFLSFNQKRCFIFLSHLPSMSINIGKLYFVKFKTKIIF
ncbi:hypothetical protein AX758_04920 [Enterococcus mundtii]|nr:hypothetical protein AX758_04920 [Enterococcus mundtii]PTO40270.1 hypothetical protein C6P52_01845 [Enterococcus mundtii]